MQVVFSNYDVCCVWGDIPGPGLEGLMRKYLIFPGRLDGDLNLLPEWRNWIENWLYDLNERVERGCISSTECVQGALCEIALHGGTASDWLSVERKLLRDEECRPMAYSHNYGRRLSHFEGQWRQMTVYAIYNSFWLSELQGEKNIAKYQRLIYNLIQPDGFIYNPSVSDTQRRNRMKSELLMSLAMGTELLSLEKMKRGMRERFEAVLACMPMTNSISAEYFRYQALQNIGCLRQYPEGLGKLLRKCEAFEGYHDFCVLDKTDDYMGTKKRTQHDVSIHSPLIAAMAQELSCLGEECLRQGVRERLHRYALNLERNPLEIPAFQMREIPVPFGQGVTPFEILAAAALVCQAL